MGKGKKGENCINTGYKALKLHLLDYNFALANDGEKHNLKGGERKGNYRNAQYIPLIKFRDLLTLVDEAGVESSRFF